MKLRHERENEDFLTLCEIKKRRNTCCLSSIFGKTKLKKDHFITVDKFQDMVYYTSLEVCLKIQQKRGHDK